MQIKHKTLHERQGYNLVKSLKLLALLIVFTFPFSLLASDVFISEIYFLSGNTGDDEAVEIAGPTGTSLEGWRLVLYDGTTGLVYDEHTFSSSDIFSNQATFDNGIDYGLLAKYYNSNGMLDDFGGLALVDKLGIVRQFLSYGGIIAAVDGLAMGMLSQDIGINVSELLEGRSVVPECDNNSNYPCYVWKPWQQEQPAIVLFYNGSSDFCGVYDKSYKIPRGAAYFIDRFGNTYTEEETRIKSSSIGSSNCSCSDLGINTSYFELYFEDCILGTGTDGSTITQRAVICRAFRDIANTIIPENINTKVNIKIEPSSASNYFPDGRDLKPLENNVGAIGSAYYNAIEKTGIVDALPWKIINSGFISTGLEDKYHGVVRVNFNLPDSNFKWYLGESAPSTVDLAFHDLYTVVLHQATHLLGFASLLHGGGNPVTNQDYVLNREFLGGYSRFDKFLTLSPDNIDVIQNDLTDKFNWNFNQQDIPTHRNLYGSCQDPERTGPDMIFNNNSDYPIFTGTPGDASAFSHLIINCDGSFKGTFNMDPNLPKGTRRIWSSKEKEILCQLGYRLNGMGGCNCIIAGVDDRTKANNEILTVHSGESLVITINDLLYNDINAVDIQAIEFLEEYRGTVTRSGNNLIITPEGLGESRLKYIPVGCDGEIGNITYVYLEVTKNNQIWPMEEFIGVNMRREDPLEYLDCIGFIREYHDWVIDEGNDCNSQFSSPSDIYPNNKFKFNPGYQGQTYIKFDEFYNDIRNVLEYNHVVRPPICANMKWALPHLAGGDLLGSYSEFMPLFTNLSPEFRVGPKPPRDAMPNPGQNPNFTIYPVNANGDEDWSQTSNPNAYLWYADWINQFTRRYGSTPTVNRNTLKLHPLEYTASALNAVGYMEIWNEQDKNFVGQQGSSWRKITQFESADYAALASASYDGHVNTMIAENPDGEDNNGDPIIHPDYVVGTNSADPNMKYVFGALTEFDDLAIQYVDDVKAWCEVNRAGAEKVFPFDVVNFHHYSDNNWIGNNGPDAEGFIPPAVSPEDDNYNGVTFKEQLVKVKEHFSNPANGYGNVELWMSEFGYDTNENSPLRTPTIMANGITSDQQEIQGQWIVRTYLEIASAGWDRAMQFCIRDTDTDSKNPITFESSGLVRDRENNHAPKKSYYYVYTMKENLRGTKFDRDDSENYSNNIRVYRFRNSESGEYVYAIWSPTSENRQLNNVRIDLPPNTSQATVVTSEVGDINGVRTSLSIQSDASGKFTIVPSISERPVYLRLGESITDTPVACVSGLNATPVSCDAIKVNWNPRVDVEKYQVYYYEKNDSEESGAPIFNIGDLDMILYTDELPGDANGVMVSGLEKMLDTYYIFVQVVDEHGNISPPCMISESTLSCDNNNLIPNAIQLFANGMAVDISTNPSVNSLFDYHGATPCNSLSSSFNFVNEGWTNNPGSGFVNEAILTYDTEQHIESIQLLDGSGIGEFIIQYWDGGRFVDLIAYTTVPFAVWRSFPVNVTTDRLKLIKIKNEEDHPTINRLIIKGQAASTSTYATTCCGSAEPTLKIINGNTTLSNEINNGNLAANGANTRQVVRINGQLEIDQDYEFSDRSYFYMESGSSIVIKSGVSLIIDEETILAGCENLWQGIQVEIGGQIYMYNATIRDAEIGLRFYRTNESTPQSHFTINDCVFDRNLYAIETLFETNVGRNFNFTATSSIDRTIFDGSVSDLKACPTFPIYCGSRVRTGLRLARIDLNNLGVNSSLENPVIFRNLAYGIHGIGDVIIDAKNTLFQNIQPENETGGYGVNKFNGGRLIIKGYGAYKQPIFSKVKYPIEMGSSYCDISDVRIEEGDFGIKMINHVAVFGDFSKIQNNYFDVAGNVIEMQIFDFGDITVSGNEIIGNKRNTGDAILGSSFAPLQFFGDDIFEIRNNSRVKLQQGLNGSVDFAAGIRLSGTENAIVTGNELDFTRFTPEDVPLYGIYLSDAEGTIVEENNLNGIANGGGFYQNSPEAYGIYSVSSVGNLLKCNISDGVKFGLAFEGDNSATNGIKGNEIRRYGTGLLLSDGASIGQQQHTGNRWQNIPTTNHNFAALYENANATQASNSRFFVTDGVSEIAPITINPGGQIWFERESNPNYFECDPNVVASETTNSASFAAVKQVAEDNFGENGIYRKLVRKQLDNGDYADAILWVMKRHAYAAIHDLYGAAPNDEELTAFIAEQKTTTVGKFYELERELQNLSPITTEVIEQLVQLREDIDISTSQVKDFVAGLAEIPRLEQIESIKQRISLGTDLELANAVEQYNELYAQIEVTRRDRANTLLFSLSAIPVIQPYEVLELEVYSIYLNLVAGNITEIDVATAERLLDIALLCPAEAGEAALKARILYALYDSTPLPQWEDCIEFRESETEDRLIETTIRIQPNPSSGMTTISLPATPSDNTYWQVYDLTGRLLASGQLQSAKEAIHLANLVAGVYQLNIARENKLIHTEKIVIIK